MDKKKFYFSEETRKKIELFYDEKSKNARIYPAKIDIFKAFELCTYDNLKVVIIGQDPYFNEGQANGLAFSVNKEINIPPSLRNIYKEIKNEYPNFNKIDGDLSFLAKQGVLLINSILTVEEGKPLSHDTKLYKDFFNEVISNIEKKDKCVIYMLWGNNSRKYSNLISNPNHFLIESSHPSPQSANRGGWFGENQFKKCNEILKKYGLEEIRWF